MRPYAPLLLLLASASPAPRSVADVLNAFGPAAEARLVPHFAQAGESYPPHELTLIALKEEKRLEVWARTADGWKHVVHYAIQAASGGAGPKLRQGDLQVPEGAYRIAHLNPNSAYHLSMKVDYPTAFDHARAREDGRTNLGGDIFIHGKAVSIGCLAIGDPAIEELFTLVARTGRRNVQVLIAPRDLRTRPAPTGGPSWTRGLYADLAKAMAAFR